MICVGTSKGYKVILQKNCTKEVIDDFSDECKLIGKRKEYVQGKRNSKALGKSFNTLSIIQ